MTNDEIENNALAQWQRQQTEADAVSIHEIRDRAQRFKNQMRNRNVFLYTTLVGIGTWFIVSIVLFKPAMIMRVGLGLLVAGTLVIVGQFPRRLHTRGLSPDLGLLPSIEFYRRELEREHHARRSILSWYILPVVPGLSVILVAMALTPDGRGVVPAVILTTLFAAIFIVTVTLNQRAARHLQREIDELPAR